MNAITRPSLSFHEMEQRERALVMARDDLPGLQPFGAVLRRADEYLDYITGTPAPIEVKAKS